MASEIALTTTDWRSPTGWRPCGAAIVCCSDHCIRRKWLEICCDLVSPKKRDNFKGIPGWKRLCDAWTQDLHDVWFAYGRPSKQYPLGRLLQDRSFPQQVWETIIEPLGVTHDLPLAPEAEIRVHDTWLWSEHERKVYFIVVNTDADSKTVESWQDVEERRINGALTAVWKTQVRYWEDMGLSGETLRDIADVGTVVHPRFDKPVSAARFVRPDLAEVRLA